MLTSPRIKASPKIHRQPSVRPARVVALQSVFQQLRNAFGAKPFNVTDRVKLGSLSVSPMGLGTWAWGNKFLWNYDTDMDGELQEVFNLAVKSGINLFDTADSYGTGPLNGRSESLLGQFMREYPGSQAERENIHIATKFAAYPWRLTPGSVVGACKESLGRLQVDKLSVGQLHWSTSNYLPLQEGALQNGLADCYEKGLVREVGVSNYGAKQLRKVHANLARRGVPLASVQVQFSLLSRGKAQLALQETAAELGVTLIAYSPLALGLLSDSYSLDQLPAGPRGLLFRQLLPKLQPLLAMLRAIAKGRNKTVPQVAINWCMCQGTIPIPGAKSLSQVKDNLGALGWRLSAGELAELERAADSLAKDAVMVQNVFQTN